jgi:hypothetical protein
MFGKKLSDYLRFQGWVLALIVVLGFIRLALSLAGVPNATVKWFSITAAMLVGLVYYAVAVHTKGFGSYKQLYGLLLIQSIVTESIPIVAILLAMVTGQDNIYVAPEYSGGGDGKNWGHVLGHVFVGAIVLPLVGWLLGSAILFVTKRVAPRGSAPATA